MIIARSLKASSQRYRQGNTLIKREREEEFESLFLAPPAEHLLVLSADLPLGSYNETVKGFNLGLTS